MNAAPTDAEQLLGLARAEQQHAKRVFRAVEALQGLSTVLALAVLLVSGRAAVVLAIVAVLAQLTGWSLRRKATGLHLHAEEGRRRAQFMASLGSRAEPLDVAELRRGFSKSACRHGREHEDPDYWASDQSPGPARLREALQEGAFYSAHLYTKAGQRTIHMAIAFLLALVVAAALALVLFEGPEELAAARVAAVLLSSWIALDYLGKGLSWQRASERMNAIDRRLEPLDPDQLEAVLAIVADNSVATALAAPIPDSVYEREKDRLDELWRQRKPHRTSNPD